MSSITVLFLCSSIIFGKLLLLGPMLFVGNIHSREARTGEIVEKNSVENVSHAHADVSRVANVFQYIFVSHVRMPRNSDKFWFRTLRKP